MDAETLDLARRFAACPKWVWLRGMSARSGDHPCERWLFDGEAWVSDEGDTYRLPDLCAPASLVLAVANGPDLDDEVTRAGLLPIVRRAHDDPWMGLVGSREGFWCISRPQMAWDTHPLAVDLRWMCRSELLALLAALEAATHG